MCVHTQDRQLAEQCYSENGGNVDLAIVELLQLMTFVEGEHMETKSCWWLANRIESFHLKLH